MEKMRRASEHKEVSFTEMSRRIIEPAYQDMYVNVYQKGALIGFLLDIRLKELSNGKTGMRELLLDLSKEYGPNKPFKDDELIDIIVAKTYPEVRQFFDDYVIGDKPLPYQEYYNKIGWRYADKKPGTKLTFGEFRLGFEKDRKFFWIAEPMNNTMGLQQYDILYAVNDEQLTEENIYRLLTPIIEPTTDSSVKISFIRQEQMYEEQFSPTKENIELEFVVENNPNATAEQLKLRQQVLKQVPEEKEEADL